MLGRGRDMMAFFFLNKNVVSASFIPDNMDTLEMQV